MAFVRVEYSAKRNFVFADKPWVILIEFCTRCLPRDGFVHIALPVYVEWFSAKRRWQRQPRWSPPKTTMKQIIIIIADSCYINLYAVLWIDRFTQFRAYCVANNQHIYRYTYQMLVVYTYCALTMNHTYIGFDAFEQQFSCCRLHRNQKKIRQVFILS